jgi:hypothetical protein
MITLYHKNTPTAAVVSEIESVLRSRGLYLYRYRTASRRCSHIQTITYAVHSGSDRPAKSALCDGVAYVLTQDEGKTERCESFRVLSEMLAEIQSASTN